MRCAIVFGLVLTLMTSGCCANRCGRTASVSSFPATACPDTSCGCQTGSPISAAPPAQVQFSAPQAATFGH